MIEQGEDSFITLKQGHQLTIRPMLRRKLQKTQKWILDQGKYNQELCSQMFAAAQEAAVQRMWIGFNFNSKILHQIADTQFPSLKEIWLSSLCGLFVAKNQIESIEVLSRIKMDHLQQIHLRSHVGNLGINFLISVRTMRKCNWPNIHVISIYGNKAKDLISLSELNAPKLKTLWTEYEKSDDPQPEDMSWMAKLQTSGLSSICAASQERIKQHVMYESLKKKSNQKLSIHLSQT